MAAPPLGTPEQQPSDNPQMSRRRGRRHKSYGTTVPVRPPPMPHKTDFLLIPPKSGAHFLWKGLPSSHVDSPVPSWNLRSLHHRAFEITRTAIVWLPGEHQSCTTERLTSVIVNSTFHSFIHPFINHYERIRVSLFVNSTFHSFIHSCIHSFIHSSIHLFIH